MVSRLSRLPTSAALVIGGFLRLPLLVAFAFNRRGAYSNETHARAAARWLLQAAKSVDCRGFSHSFHFARGWLPAYPETTGYIIPSLALAGRAYGVPQLDDVIGAAWDWIVEQQAEGGDFADLSGAPQVFDTGQILIGANFMYRSGDIRAAEVVRRSASWLVRQQSDDGSFMLHAYNNMPHAYYSRVGAALLEAGQLLDLPELGEAGLRNLSWTLDQQRHDGWFEHMSFSDHAPYSHTIVYTLEGLLAGFRLSGDQRMLEAVVLTSEKIRDSVCSHGGIIRSQYREGFSPVDGEICVTGLCQWAAHCFRLDRLGISGFRETAERSLEEAKRLQIHSGFATIDGALPGSTPLSGKYMRYALPNWGVKFFLDALLESERGDMPVLI